MKRLTSLSLMLLASSLAIPFSINAAEPFKAPSAGAPSDRVGAGTRHSEAEEDIPEEAVPAPVTRGVFKVPSTGAPSDRVGAGTRHSDTKQEEALETTPVPAPVTRSMTQNQAVGTFEKAQLLASSKFALTASSSPTLYWYVATVPAHGAEIVLQSSNKTLLKKTVKVTKAGMQSIRLADLGVQLKADTSYVWSVAVIVDPKQRSKDLSNFANIRYQQPDETLTSVQDMKQAGYWYDAIAQLVESHSPQLSNELSQEGIILSPAK